MPAGSRAADPTEAVFTAWRAESARLVGALTRMTRDVELAEDLAQDALVAALEQWPATGVPENPIAWLMTIARRRGIDHFRRADNLRRKVVELADLNYAGARMILATLDGVDPTIEQQRRMGRVRVATKYIHTATEYFQATGRQAELVEVKGSVELAPLTGMVDAIVDLTATGTTLKANGLVEREEIYTTTARLIANPVASALSAETVDDITRRLREVTARA